MPKPIKGTKQEKGLPSRKSMAGPTLLGTFTAPGAIRKSIALDMLGKTYSADHSSDEHKLPLVMPMMKDYTSVEGRIKIQAIVEVNKEMLCCKYNEEFDYVAVGCADGSIRMYNTYSNDFVTELIDEDIEARPSAVTGIQHRPVSKSYPINANGYVKNWNYNFNQCIFTIKESRDTFGITYHPRYTKFVTYGSDAKIYLYDEESKTQERVLSGSNNPKIQDGHTSRVFASCFHPRSNYELLTGGWDDVILFWDLRQPHAIRHISGIHICGEGIDINQKGTEILACGFQNERSFQVFDYGSGKMIGAVENKDELSKLYCGRYVNKDYAVCGGTVPNTFRVIDLTNYMSAASVLGLPSAVYSLDLGPPKKGQAGQRTDIGGLPQMAFVSAKKLYQVTFN